MTVPRISAFTPAGVPVSAARSKLEALGLSTACADVLRHLWDYLDEQITPTGRATRGRTSPVRACQPYEVYQACFLER